MKSLSGKHADEYCKAMDDKIHGIIRSYTREIIPREPLDDQNVFPGTWSFKCKRKPDWTIRKFNAQYYVRGDVQNRLTTKPLNSYDPVFYWETVKLMLILQCFIGLKSQSIDFKSAFAKADIPSGGASLH